MKTGARRANRDPRLLAIVVLIPAINQSGVAATESTFTKERNIGHHFTSSLTRGNSPVISINSAKVTTPLYSQQGTQCDPLVTRPSQKTQYRSDKELMTSPQNPNSCERRRRRHSSNSARHLDVDIDACRSPASDHRRHRNQEDRQPLPGAYS